jgi:hypothetical protein
MIFLNICYFIILVAMLCVVILYKKWKKNTEQEEIIKENLLLVEKFEKKEIKFKLLEKCNDEIEPFKTFYSISIFPDLEKVEYHIIKDEIIEQKEKIKDNWSDWSETELWKKGKQTTSWKIIPLMAFGSWSKENCKLFPKTTRELLKIKNLVSAGFSNLGPNTTLKLHKGWGELSNNVLRCHLGLIVPNDNCEIFVIGNENDKMVQKEGKWIIFDDSLYHSASNNDKEKERIVLILDIKRPSKVPKGISDIKNSDELNNFMLEFNKNNKFC